MNGCMDLNEIKCPGYAWGGGGQFLELIGTSHQACYFPIYDVINPFTPELPVIACADPCPLYPL